MVVDRLRSSERHRNLDKRMDQRVSRKPRISDVARSAGVSTATVSRALATPEKVTLATREAVVKAVREIGYVPNLAARNLRTNKTRTILAVLPDFGNVFFSLVLRGISDTLAARGYSLIIADTHNEAAREEQCAQFIAAGRVDGVLLLNGRRLFAPRDTRHSTMPMVSLCERIPGAPFPHVETENRKAAQIATSYLASLGHRRIGYVRGPRTNVLEHERFSGYQDALRQAGLGFDAALVTEGDFTLASGEAAAETYLAGAKLPDAIFACNDAMAMGLIRRLFAAGIAVPRDVSVAGFDDIEFAEAYNPAITTVRQARRQIGERAANVLLELVEGRTAVEWEVRLPAELVVRESTARRGV
ncbi:transcriptional regulator, LacI family [Rhizobiales bacterium GAS113]|nr:transcriptional regulator, LacI family [Rhizobiales bacterium GAS113]